MASMQEKVTPEDENNAEVEENEDDEVVQEGMDEANEEFLTINSQLDQISSVLDVLEQKNDRLQDQLRQLLALNREQREQQTETPEVSDALDQVVEQLASVKTEINQQIANLTMEIKEDSSSSNNSS